MWGGYKVTESHCVFFLHCVLLLACTVQEVATGAVLCGYNVPLVECEQPAAF